MDLVNTKFVEDAGDRGKCMVGLSNSKMHRYNYRPIGYHFVTEGVAIQVGLYTRGKDAGTFAAWWAKLERHQMPLKPFQGSCDITYRKTKKVGGIITIDYAMTQKEGVITNMSHQSVQFDD